VQLIGASQSESSSSIGRIQSQNPTLRYIGTFYCIRQLHLRSSGLLTSLSGRMAVRLDTAVENRRHEMVEARRCKWPPIYSKNRGNQTKKVGAKGRKFMISVRRPVHAKSREPGFASKQRRKSNSLPEARPSRLATRKSRSTGQEQKRNAKHTAAGIPTWSPTVVLICRSTAYVWQSGRDAQFSADYGRMCLILNSDNLHSTIQHISVTKQICNLSSPQVR
jgi:hypothetical protein